MKEELLHLDTVIITHRMVVRRFREQEGAAFYELYVANRVILESLLPPMLPELANQSEAEFFVRQQLAAWLRQEALAYAVWDKESAKLIGYLSLSPIDPSWRKAWCQGFMDKDRNGQGLMSEALRALLQTIFIKTGIQKVSLLTSVENVAAQRIARKCGFIREGDLREEFQRQSGEPVDAQLFGLTRHSFEKI